MRVVRFLFFLAFVAGVFSATGQYHFSKVWDKRYGGAGYEFSSKIERLGSGFLVGGESKSSASGDRTQANLNTEYADYWIICIDSVGNKLWDRKYGGSFQDNLSSIIPCANSQFMLSGYSYSNADGEKSEPSRGGFDFWLVKIDSLGNELWDKTIGGSKSDDPALIATASDGGFLLGCTSLSGVSGEKTEPSRGGEDYWIVRVDSAGNKLWDKTFGGTGYDFLTSIERTKDGGFLLAGDASSDSSGEKSQNSNGGYDFWLIKIDSTGNKLWDKSYGGSSWEISPRIEQTINGDIILGGWGYSGNSGMIDFRIFKLDSAGNEIWNKDYGGNGDDQLFFIELTNDNGMLVAGSSLTFAVSGDKSENNIVDGYKLPWILKLDSAGNKIWDKTIFLNSPAWWGDILQTGEDCYLLSASTTAGVGYYKSQPSWSEWDDYWLIKFCMEPAGIGIEEPSKESGISVYPNPVSSDISIAIKQEGIGEATFTVTNSIGEVVYHRKETNLGRGYTKNLDLTPLPNGVYFVEVEMNGEKVVKQVVKE